MNHFCLPGELSVQNYLQRIGYTGTLENTLENLSVLQLAHIMSIPYENLEILARIPISLSVAALYDKIVVRKRGGYCFELNGLFVWLLGELGYAPIELSGRWHKNDPMEIPPRRHRVSKVALDGKQYICDVGVGMPAPKFPLVLEDSLIQEQDGDTYRIISHPKLIWIVQELLDGKWCNFYSFSDDPQQPVDFFLPHYYCTTHPDSYFLSNTMVYIRTEHGRNTVADVYDPETGERVAEFRISQPHGGLIRFIPRSNDEFKFALKKYFGITITE